MGIVRAPVMCCTALYIRTVSAAACCPALHNADRMTVGGCDRADRMTVGGFSDRMPGGVLPAFHRNKFNPLSTRAHKKGQVEKSKLECAKLTKTDKIPIHGKIGA